MNNIICQEKEYYVGVYIRLSKEDLNKNEESQSVTNQKNVLVSYVKEHNYNLVDIYVDDGFTGTNFDRPGFKKMINDIENKKINMVITKDLSRLGRDYIETGEYIEKYFPRNNIRYISLLDGIDTEIENTNNDIAPFKAVINDMYSRDNSKKIRTAIKTMQLKGKWVGGCTPLGYKQDPNDKNHLIPNQEEVPIIKKIFELAITGISYYQIAIQLIKEKVPTFSMIRHSKKCDSLANSGYWSPKTIKTILSNEMYIGNMVQNKNKRISYKIRKNIHNKKENWIIVKNTHQPIIDEYTFYEVQRILPNSKTRQKKHKNNLLDGLLYCADCGHKISICKPNKYGKTYIACNYYRMHSKEKLCTSHAFNYDDIEQKIINELKHIYIEQIDKKELLKNPKNNNIKNIITNNEEIKMEISFKENQLDKIYLDKINNKISEDMYERIKNKIIGNINLLNEQMKNIQNKKKIENNNEKMKALLELENPNREIIIKLIDRINIHKNKEIDIFLNFINNHKKN